MSINSVAARIWNEIAEQGNLATAWAKKAFSMSEEELSQEEDREYKALLKQGEDHEVASAFLDVRHLLAESKAIRAYVKKHPQLSAALPEVNSVNEAILLAMGDTELSLSQTKRLRELLQSELKQMSA